MKPSTGTDARWLRLREEPSSRGEDEEEKEEEEEENPSAFWASSSGVTPGDRRWIVGSGELRSQGREYYSYNSITVQVSAMGPLAEKRRGEKEGGQPDGDVGMRRRGTGEGFGAPTW